MITLEDMKGIFPAPITPFDAENKINEKALTALIEKNIKEGVKGVFIGGSSAECFMLSHEERIRVFEIAASFKKRLKLIAHIGSISTDEAITFGLKAKELGYNAIAATAPYYYKFSPQAIVKYFQDIYEAVGMPVIVYNFPGNTGVEFDLSHPDIVQLFKSSAVLGVKHTNLNVYQLERIKNLNNKLLMYNGFDEVLIAGLALGADGAIGSTFNFMFPHYQKIEQAFKALEIDKARALQTKANNIMQAIVSVGLIPAIKYILTLQGIEAGIPRRPFGELTEEQKQFVQEVLKENLVQ
ncbi:MAG: dihydrodipicolinate synthetase [Clostridia bacterium]|jgi:N-acetylneuraminate lyase|nr:dihydrodipicolinate synthetase [Clostridia bacterium]